MSTPRITLAMIVRDEERCIGRALGSAVELVDDIVVVDTGSTDATVTIAESHGARIEHFTWIDDFAAARNHALRVASGDVVLMLDADEWVDQGDPSVLRRWAHHAGPRTAGYITVVSGIESDGHTLTTQARIVRVIPRGCHFIGQVHEQATGFESVTTVDGLRVYHDGYHTPQLDRKRGRNERLLRQLLASAPDSPYLLFQFGRERQIAGAFNEAADAYLAALPHVDDKVRWRDDIRARVIYSLHRAGRTAQALKTTSSLLDGDSSPSAEVLFAAGNLFLDIAVATPSRRHEFLPMARSAWRACLAVGEPTDDRDYTPGCGTFLAAENLAAICQAEEDNTANQHWMELAASFRRRDTSAHSDRL